jgi:hypothetical protein
MVIFIGNYRELQCFASRVEGRYHRFLGQGVKPSKSKCSSHRPFPGKVFAQVLLFRIEPLLVKYRSSQQSGFTTGRSAADAVLALHLLSKEHREFNRPLYVGYVDLKSAFDSVDREAL